MGACTAVRRIGYASEMRAARMILFFVLPVAAAVVLGILGSIGVLRGLDGRAYDQLLRLRPSAPAPANILLVDIDAQAGSLAGLLADGLVTLKEMDARYAVLDLPLAQKSPPALDPVGASPDPAERAGPGVLPDAGEHPVPFRCHPPRIGAPARRGALRLRPGGARGQGQGSALRRRHGDRTRRRCPARAGRRVLRPRLCAAGSAGRGRPARRPRTSSTWRSSASPFPSSSRGSTRRSRGGIPTVGPAASSAGRGAAASRPTRPMSTVCAEGRVSSLMIAGQHVGQLAFAGAHRHAGQSRDRGLSGPRSSCAARCLPGGTTVDRAIPLDESGEMLLTWPRAFPDDGFRHLAWSTLLQQRRLEDSLVADLRDLDSRGYLSYLRSSDSLLDVYEEGARLGRGMLAAGSDADVDPWRAAREQFFSLCDQFLGGDAPSRIIADADRTARRAERSPRTRKPSSVRSGTGCPPPSTTPGRSFHGCRPSRASLRDSLAGSFCILSHGRSTRLPAPP